MGIGREDLFISSLLSSSPVPDTLLNTGLAVHRTEDSNMCNMYRVYRGNACAKEIEHKKEGRE